MTSRTNRKVIAEETLEIIRKGHYVHPSTQETIDLHKSVQESIAGSKLYGPNSDFEYNAGSRQPMTVEVLNTTSLEACEILWRHQPLCLNFASAKNPGGGFLGGSRAQEESLARSSALYPTLLEHPTYYEQNRANKSCFYLDYMIYSPKVPVFRDDNGLLLRQARKVSFITAPAVNAGVVQKQEPERTAMIPVVMARRIDRVLSLALHHGHQYLVLGAWGCGVFRNDPKMVAQLFAEALRSDKFANRFKHIIFAVLDKEPIPYRYQQFQKALEATNYENLL